MKIIASIFALLISNMALAKYPLMRVLQDDMPNNFVSIFIPPSPYQLPTPIPACGAGSYIFPSYSWLSSVPASATNSASSAFAPTSTTMNASECKGPKSIADNDQEIIRYAQANKKEIFKDIAKGDGESLDALAALLEIPALERDKWKQVLKADFALIFPTENTDINYVLDQIVRSGEREQIKSPLARNLNWRELQIW